MTEYSRCRLPTEGWKSPKSSPRGAGYDLNDGSCIRLRPEHKDHVWSYDFVMARTADGRAFGSVTDKVLRQGGTVPIVMVKAPKEAEKT